MANCCVQVWSGFGYRSNPCSREGVLEHAGKLYCKQHHPPSKLLRSEKAPKCQAILSYGPCGIAIHGGAKYCATHRYVYVDRTRYLKLLADSERLQKLVETGVVPAESNAT